jgi:CubicO group peptidase (beta-lactamase class C family)
MIRNLFFLLCIGMATFFPGTSSAFWGFSKSSPKVERAKVVLEDVDKLIEQSIKNFLIPGVAVGIVVDGTVVYTKGFGFRDLEKKKCVTPDTLFPIGSVTKAFTAFSMGCLIDEGVMEWDDRVVDWLSEFRLSDESVSQKLTLRELLSHQTRLPRHDYMWYNGDLTREELFCRLRYLDMASDSYDRFHYNNLLYTVVGMAVEKAAHKKWEEVVTQKILNPMGMTHTGFSVADMQKSTDYALPYIERKGELKQMKFRDYSSIAPAGGMYSSVSDLCRWIQMQLSQGEWQKQPLLSLMNFKEMHSPQVIVSGCPESKEPQVRAYGLGWYIQSYQGALNIVHDGIADGFVSVVSLLPQKNIGIVVLSNKNFNPWSRLLVMDLFDRLLEIPRNEWLKDYFDGWKKNNELTAEDQSAELNDRKKNTTPSHSLEEYAGEYENPGYGRIEVQYANGKLQTLYNNFLYTLEHWHYDMFNVCEESDDALVSFRGNKLTFRTDSHGNVSELLVPFEKMSPDIVFLRKPVDLFSSADYLRAFTGVYEIYSYTVEIILRNNVLYAVIPGQSTFELTPTGKNEFSVKSYSGFSVRFSMNANNEVQEALLVLPYGMVYTGVPKRAS